MVRSSRPTFMSQVHRWVLLTSSPCGFSLRVAIRSDCESDGVSRRSSWETHQNREESCPRRESIFEMLGSRKICVNRRNAKARPPSCKYGVEYFEKTASFNKCPEWGELWGIRKYLMIFGDTEVLQGHFEVRSRRSEGRTKKLGGKRD